MRMFLDLFEVLMSFLGDYLGPLNLDPSIALQVFMVLLCKDL
jgi:hypothetical protein